LGVFNIDPAMVDLRSAIGRYELLVSASSDFNPDFSDDHSGNDDEATAIPIDNAIGSPTSGRGSVTGGIDDNLTNPTDDDTFQYFATGLGQVTLAATATGSNVALDVDVFNANNIQVTSGVSLPGGTLNLSWFAQRGEVYFIIVNGAGGS